jgi:two-component system, LytTR family, response regulator
MVPFREAKSTRESQYVFGSESMWISNVVSAGLSDHHQPSDDRLIVKSGGRVIFVPVTEIDWIQAAANYVRLYCTGRQPLLFRKPISKFAQQLDNSRFIRIHRSYIVNVSRIRELQPCNSGEFIVSLRDGKELPCSRTYRRALQALYSPRHA